jgi:CheY-like chemotaxis protein
LAGGNLLLPFCVIDLACLSRYLRDISPLQRKTLARKILLADDSVTAQNMGRKILSDAGYEVVTVNNGSAALKKVNEAKPDVIVLDVYMPGYSGLEVCQRLKDVGETARIPILLTVGKLEPFKPEEARRARADAFIVKPFEASELLSALSKLEDKIVPRSEPHKPGRFARVIAAVEGSRYDRTMTANPDEDAGWKNRIAFPSNKKKEEADDEDVDDPGFYNPLNKDLRTTVEHSSAHKQRQAEPEGSRVDLGALSPQGVPKDVTPEEIAALAAAAAQIKAKTGGKQETENRTAERHPAEDRSLESGSAKERAPETHSPEEVKPPQISEPEPQSPVATQPLVQGEATALEVKAEDKAEAKQEQPAGEVSKDAARVPPTEEVVVREKVREEARAEVEAAAEKPRDAEKEIPSFAATHMADAVAARAPEPVLSAIAPPDSGNGAHIPADEPITMAAAAGAEFTSTASHWTAVPVALLPEESAISLEQEMQKTYAALAAAEMAHAAPQKAMTQSQPATMADLPMETSLAEPAAPVPPTFLSEVAETMRNVASNAADAIRAAVKEFETVHAPQVEQGETQPPASAKLEVTPAQTEESAAEAPRAVEAKAEGKGIAESVTTKPEAAASQSAPEPVAHEQELEREQKTEPKYEEPQPVIEAAPPAFTEISARVPEAETTVPTSVSETAAEPTLASQVSQQVREVSEKAEPSAGGTDEMAKKEREIAATTAAAWASWRRIRETGGPKNQSSPEPAKKEAEEEAVALADKDDAAMAVAAGAEKTPDEIPPEGESAEIASIVDSVLADLRPKIVEEISKKLGKKK